MTQMESYGMDLYARHTECDGKSALIDHRVWDKELFVARKTEQAALENSKQKPGEPRLAKFEQITKDQYLAGRKK